MSFLLGCGLKVLGGRLGFLRLDRGERMLREVESGGRLGRRLLLVIKGLGGGGKGILKRGGRRGDRRRGGLGI